RGGRTHRCRGRTGGVDFFAHAGGGGGTGAAAGVSGRASGGAVHLDSGGMGGVVASGGLRRCGFGADFAVVLGGGVGLSCFAHAVAAFGGARGSSVGRCGKGGEGVGGRR